jgi:DNA-binding MarR family transcriptional regulator
MRMPVYAHSIAYDTPTKHMKKTGRAKPPQLSWEDVGFICEGLAFASRLLWTAIRDITDEYSLGPRGAWIVRLVGIGDMSPLDLTNVFRVGRSLITAELVRLTQADLITYKKSASDGRRVELALTTLGRTVERRVKESLTQMVTQRLSSYTREDILLCGRMLRDIRTPAPENAAPKPRRRGTPARRG